MPSKKNPLPLHVSRALIEAERANVLLRTQRRIAILRANEDKLNNQEDEDPVTIRTVHTHSCLNMFCFCVSLVTANLLFLQWLYYKVNNSKQV
jgi:hypothetical protein